MFMTATTSAAAAAAAAAAKKRATRKGKKKTKPLSMHKALQLRNMLLWKLTVSLGVPRTGEQFIQWELGSTLRLEDSKARQLDWQDWSQHEKGFWMFFPQKIKCPDQEGRSVNQFEPVLIPRNLNAYMQYYLRFVRPVLASGAPFADHPSSSHFFLKEDGTPMQARHRLGVHKALLHGTIGREYTIRQVRKSVGTHVVTTKMSEKDRDDAIAAMGHTKETHMQFYVVPNAKDPLDKVHVPRFFAQMC